MAIQVVTASDLGPDFTSIGGKIAAESVLTDTADPSGLPPVTNKAWVHVNTTTRKAWVWDPATSAWLSFPTVAAPAALVLPVPKVRLQRQTVVSAQMANGAGCSVYRHPEIVADVHTALLDPALDLRLEILRQVSGARSTPRRRTRRWTFAHPVPFDGVASAVSGRGDSYGGATNGVIPPRPTEWAVTSRNQVIVPEIAAHFDLRPVTYAAKSGLTQIELAIYRGRRGQTGRFGNQSFPGSPRRVGPGHFRFRYSVKDPDHPVGRILGPESTTIAVGNQIDPFIDMTDGSVWWCDIANGFDPKTLGCWFAQRRPN